MYIDARYEIGTFVAFIVETFPNAGSDIVMKALAIGEIVSLKVDKDGTKYVIAYGPTGGVIEIDEGGVQHELDRHSYRECPFENLAKANGILTPRAKREEERAAEKAAEEAAAALKRMDELEEAEYEEMENDRRESATTD
jgi:hypothetical protein